MVLLGFMVQNSSTDTVGLRCASTGVLKRRCAKPRGTENRHGGAVPRAVSAASSGWRLGCVRGKFLPVG